jgi:dolichyl-phosphate-mannose-protein mannosyltransferase
MAATPQKSDLPVSTIGGEHDGRPLVVVPDIEQGEKPKEEHTSIAEGKPEPGRNVFEGEVVNDVKSEAPKHAPPPADVKEISSVVTRESKASSDGDGNSSSSSSDSSTATSSSSSSTATSSVSDMPRTDERKKKPAGPLGEAEAEAEKAASELYPDAVKQ